MARERFRCVFERKKETGWREQRKKLMRARIMKERGVKCIRQEESNPESASIFETDGENTGYCESKSIRKRRKKF